MFRTSIVLVASVLSAFGLTGCTTESSIRLNSTQITSSYQVKTVSAGHRFQLNLEDGIHPRTGEALLNQLPDLTLACAEEIIVQHSPVENGEEYLVTVFWLIEEYLQSEIWRLS